MNHSSRRLNRLHKSGREKQGKIRFQLTQKHTGESIGGVRKVKIILHRQKRQIAQWSLSYGEWTDALLK